ncbi:MAG: hypothetical protein RI912_901, partial [Actinomycetota bacterium]
MFIPQFLRDSVGRNAVTAMLIFIETWPFSR